MPTVETSPESEIPLADWLRHVGSMESHTVEKLIEHLFLAEVLQECWFRRRHIVEVLRAEVDSAGYDLILESQGRIRHVQLKASRKGARTSRQTINSRLADREGGCIVWVFYSVDPDSCRAELTYRWREASHLPEKRGKRTRGGGERPNMRVLRKGEFESVPGTAELVNLLFGTSSAGGETPSS